MSERVQGQDGGTFPPRDRIQGAVDAANGAGGLPIKGIYLLDGSNNPIFVPDLSYERWNEISSGAGANSRLFACKSVEVTGSATESRAELDLRLRVSISPTDGQLVPIALQMSNFHLLEAPRFQVDLGDDAESQSTESKSTANQNSANQNTASQAKQFQVTSAADGNGYLLWTKSDESCDVLVDMKMAVRVESNPSPSIAFRLPDAPSQINISTDMKDVFGDVVGRGDEVIETQATTKGTHFRVESGGGRLTLRWSGLQRGIEKPLLEVESDVTLRWNSPQDLPIQSTTMEIRNLRGAVSTFELRLPPGATLLDTPQLSASGRVVELSKPKQTPAGTQWTVTVPEDERLPRIDLSLDVQLAGNDATASSPLAFRVPEIVGAIRQSGDIQIRTSDDYRLRWRDRLYVESIPDTSAAESSNSRSYMFRYDRSSFNLPLWMSATQRQLRVSSQTEIQLYESAAEMEMTIQFTGQTAENRSIRLDLVDWEHRAIIDSETGNSLPYSETDQYLEILLDPGSADVLPPITIEAHRKLERDNDGNRVTFQLPRIIKTDESVLIQVAELDIRSRGRSLLVADLAQSTGLERSLTASKEDTVNGDQVDRFRIVPPDEPARLVGSLVQQPPRITLAAAGSISLNGQSIETVVNWTLTSQTDLEGRLRVAIPRFDAATPTNATAATNAAVSANTAVAAIAGDTQTEQPAATKLTDSSAQKDSTWTVFVDERFAILRPVTQDADESVYELISPELSRGTHVIRWRTVAERIVADPESATRTVQANSQPQPISLPRPIVDDTTIRGDIVMQLVGDESNELMVPNSASRSQLVLQSLPRESLRVSVVATESGQQDLTIRRAVLRSAIGERNRQEQLLVSTEGGDFLTVELTVADIDIQIQAYVNGAPAEFRREAKRIMVRLPDDQAVHIVDLRVWATLNKPTAFEKVSPLIQLPYGVTRTYWQLIAMSDSHLVWASPDVGRAMTWTLDRLRFARQPLHNDASLAAWVGASETVPMPEGNRYLFVGSDARSFSVRVASRTMIWLWVSGWMVMISIMLIYFPRTRHPFTAVLAALAFAGLLIIAPDAAVMVGQIAAVALALVVVMLAVRSLLQPPPARVLVPTRQRSTSEGSTRTIVPPSEAERPSSMSATRSIEMEASGGSNKGMQHGEVVG
ncbi:hypothetical protein [Stieleria varia]|uniref:hypothetical protein n=1 Tax=Stieleria varia TaxID=2528005 RepID=UPI0011B49B6F|nr:hypothetical protein [Stieleria varia]